MAHHEPPTDETQKLTEAIEELDETIEKSLKSSGYFPSFLRGVFGALGAAIGATIILGLIVFVLQKLSEAPVIGHYIFTILNQLQQGK